MAKSKKNQKSSQKEKVPPKRAQIKPSSFRHLIAIGLIAGVALLGYSNTFHVPFHFYDRPNITQNPNVQIKVFSWDPIERLIKNTYKESIRVFSYFTFALNYYFGGLNVFGYHLVKFLVHIASGIFLYLFLLLTFNLPPLKETAPRLRALERPTPRGPSGPLSTFRLQIERRPAGLLDVTYGKAYIQPGGRRRH